MRKSFIYLSIALLCLPILMLTGCNPGNENPETVGEDTIGATMPVSTDDWTPGTSAESTPESEFGFETVTVESETESDTTGDTESESETKPPVPVTLYVIQEGQSDYVLFADSYTAQVAAESLKDAIQKATGAALTVEVSDEGGTSESSHTIRMRMATAEEVGNYGYAISVEGTHIVLRASGLAGFDGAIARLLGDTVSDGQMVLESDYRVAEQLNWVSDYSFDTGYNKKYRDDTFYNDKNDAVAYASNAMWHMFGLVDDGKNLVAKFGNEPTWYEWISEKAVWSGNAEQINTLKNLLITFPQTSTGYMWSWASYPYWKVDDCYSIHYDGTFRYISAVYDIISWEGSTRFLAQLDNTSAVVGARDASNGRTVLDKTIACMDYILEYLNGKEGYILITERSTYLNEDGSERFDQVFGTDYYCWNNTGRDGSSASNYWDNLCFGNYDAYENALFYQALNSMIGIYRMLGGEYHAKADELEALAETVREKFNELYWSEEAGRYISCIDVDGRRIDYGLTFLNFEAMKYGLADEEQAKRIFEWIDGERTVAGDTRTGAEVLSYAEILKEVNDGLYAEVKALDLRLAAVSNTVAINNADNQKTGNVWWHGPAAIDPFGSARYGSHLENGGYIFYPVFYELMARTQYEGIQSTTERLLDISRVLEYSGLKTDYAARGSAAWLEGLIGEFPESGLVPTVYLYSFLGVETAHDGLHIAPAFNDVYEYMGVKKLTYAGLTYGIEVGRDGSCTITCHDEKAIFDLCYTPSRFAEHDFTVTLVGTDGKEKSFVFTPEDGVLHITLENAGIVAVKITPKF